MARLPSITTIQPPPRAPIRIHVNQHVIRSNRKNGEDKAMVTVKRGRDNFYAHEVELTGEATVVSPSRGLSCGAKVWIETRHPVRLVVRC